ncbi:MAG TPA: sugar transferase [Pilimelia sp.]|nr:sugar transferase [Pilimelia sp.]
MDGRFDDEPTTTDLSRYYDASDDDTLMLAAIQDDYDFGAAPASPEPVGVTTTGSLRRVIDYPHAALARPTVVPDRPYPVIPGRPPAQSTAPPLAPTRPAWQPAPAPPRPADRGLLDKVFPEIPDRGFRPPTHREPPDGRVPDPVTRPPFWRRREPVAGRASWQGRYVATLLAVDVLVGLAAGALAFALRFNHITAYNRFYLAFSALLPVALVAVLAMNRAYERRYLYVGTDEYQRVIRAGLALTAGAAVVSYALDIQLARSYVLVALPAATLSTVLTRFLIRKRLHRRRARGQCLRRVIVVGHELAVIHLTRQLRRERFHGLEVVGACLPPRHDGQVGLPVYGTFDDVAEAVEAATADTVIVLSCPELDGHVLRRLAWRLERDDIDLIVASALIDVAGDRTTIRPVDGLPMLHVEHPRLEGGARVVKEIVDRVGATVLLLALSPVLLALAAWIRVSSPGPVLFRQVRVGRDGTVFRIFKFRSMYLDAERRLAGLRHLNEHDGLLFKMRNDPRVTPVGRWLRKLSLDELPQLINVLKGDMSLVGPRPPLPEEVAAYPDDVRRRLAVKPGMTGLWQVSGRSDLPWEEAVRLDLRYVENWSLTLDFVILMRTVAAVLRSSGAY